MRKPTNSAMGTVSRMRWPRPTVSRYCAQSGMRDVVNLLGKVPDKLSVGKLECWMWDQVYTQNALPVLTLAMCMVIDIVFPVSEKRCHLRTAGLERWFRIFWQRLGGGKASCSFAVRSFHRGGLAVFFGCCLRGRCKESLIPRVRWCLASERRAV